MNSLPDETLLVIAKSLPPLDFCHFCLVSNRFSRLRNDDELFRAFYERDYLSLLRTYSDEDIKAATNNVKPKYKYHLKHSLRDTNLSDKKIERFHNTRLEPGWTWKQIYAVLHRTRITIEQELEMCHCLREVTKVRQLYLHYNHSVIEDGCGVFFHSFIQTPIVRSTNKFRPDYLFAPAVKIHHLDVAHQVSLVDKDIGRRDEEDPDSDSDDDFDPSMPTHGHHQLISEGLVVWNAETLKYVLMYPIMGVRHVFDECSVIVRKRHQDRTEKIVEILSEKILVVFEVVEPELLERHFEVAKKAVEGWLDLCELELAGVDGVENHLRGIISADGSQNDDALENMKTPEAQTNQKQVRLMCGRKPNWKYRDGQCVFHDSNYDHNQRKMIVTNCTNRAIQKGKRTEEKETPWRKHYCRQHVNKITCYGQCLSHLKVRKKLRNLEYLSYDEKFCADNYQKPVSLGFEQEGKDVVILKLLSGIVVGHGE